MTSVFHVNAFTLPDRRFSGNPAAVCLLEQGADEGWMSRIASQMNLSETAFVVPETDGFGLRWFTPVVEVALCGHATLASAHVLWEAGRLPRSTPARFHTKSGLLTAVRDGGWIELDFPATPAEPADAPPGLLEALGVTASYVGRSRFDYLVHVETDAVLRGKAPDHARLRQVPVRGVMVTSPSAEPGVDFASRFFAPGSGIDEDPVTGSAHCCLTPYWSRILGRDRLVAHQLSSRGGELHVRLDDTRVRLRGRACSVVRGELLL
jgi:predicted PhzF superfamily epimerase YddE/YHI9